MSKSFVEILDTAGLDRDTAWAKRLDSVTRPEVERELGREPGRFDLSRLAVLVSPVASDFLEPMARQAQALTLRRFGRTVGMYVPLYLSNYCINQCEYCGYNARHEADRVRLTVDEAVEQANVLAKMGFRDLLLLSGEDPKYITPDYLCELAERLKGTFASLSVEIYPLSQSDYARICRAGIDGVTLYQETYDRGVYERYHKIGPKADYDQRVDAVERFARTGMRRFGLGALLGLSDWRTETLALGLHADYLMRRYWQGQVSFSFPRIRPAGQVDNLYPNLVSDRELVQMMLALRLCFADVGIVLSTRESAELRDHMIGICVTKISAGSKTNPGGYGEQDRECPKSSRQFEIDDTRTPSQIAEMIRKSGKEAVWKDWDVAFTGEWRK